MLRVPTHLEVSDEALMLKKVACTVLAMHLPMSVFPVPGGPNRRIPFGGPLSPVKRSLEGQGDKEREGGRENGKGLASSFTVVLPVRIV